MSTRCSLLDLIEAERELYAYEESEKQESWERDWEELALHWRQRYVLGMDDDSYGPWFACGVTGVDRPVFGKKVG